VRIDGLFWYMASLDWVSIKCLYRALLLSSSLSQRAIQWPGASVFDRIRIGQEKGWFFVLSERIRLEKESLAG
jgi:hypothetical protein